MVCLRSGLRPSLRHTTLTVPHLSHEPWYRKWEGVIDAKGWGKFALDAGMSWPFVRQRVRHIVGLVQAKIESVMAEFASLDLDQAVVGDLAVLIMERAASCEPTLTK